TAMPRSAMFGSVAIQAHMSQFHVTSAGVILNATVQMRKHIPNSKRYPQLSDATNVTCGWMVPAAGDSRRARRVRGCPLERSAAGKWGPDRAHRVLSTRPVTRSAQIRALMEFLR